MAPIDYSDLNLPWPTRGQPLNKGQKLCMLPKCPLFEARVYLTMALDAHISVVGFYGFNLVGPVVKKEHWLDL